MTLVFMEDLLTLNKELEQRIKKGNAIEIVQLRKLKVNNTTQRHFLSLKSLSLGQIFDDFFVERVKQCIFRDQILLMFFIYLSNAKVPFMEMKSSLVFYVNFVRKDNCFKVKMLKTRCARQLLFPVNNVVSREKAEVLSTFSPITIPLIALLCLIFSKKYLHKYNIQNHR